MQKSAHMRCVLGRWESPAEQKHKVHLNRDEAGEVKRAEIDGWLIYVGHSLISNKKKLKLVDEGKDLITTSLNKMINSEVWRRRRLAFQAEVIRV